jgi:hypothetical protein
MEPLEKSGEEVTKPSALAVAESQSNSTDVDQAPHSTPATRRELWSYYAYYAGNNGIGSFQ